MKQILISSCGISIKGCFYDTPTALKIWETLPIKGTVNVWGEEIYFTIPLKAGLDTDAVKDVEIGTIAYWPTGPALCIFFGPTPVSTGDKPRAYSKVNIVGRTMDDPAPLKTVPDGADILIEAFRERPGS